MLWTEMVVVQLGEQKEPERRIVRRDERPFQRFEIS